MGSGAYIQELLLPQRVFYSIRIYQNCLIEFRFVDVDRYLASSLNTVSNMD